MPGENQVPLDPRCKKKTRFSSGYVKPHVCCRTAHLQIAASHLPMLAGGFKNSCQFSQQSQLATCGELGEGWLALVDTPEGTDGEVVAGARAKGLQGVLAEGGLQAEGGPPPLPIRQPVLQQDGVHLGTRWCPLHEGHCVRDVPHQDLRRSINDCRRRGKTSTCYFGRAGWGKVAALGTPSLRDSST